MSHPPSQPGSSLNERVDTLIAHVEEAERAADANTLPDLSALDEATQQLCADITKASPQDAKAAQESMGTLITRLDTLAQRIKDIQDSSEAS